MKLTRTFNTALRLPWMVCVALTAGAAWAAPSAAPDPKVRAYFQQHCLKCHDVDAEKGDFRIDNLSPKVGFEDTLVLWSGELGRTPWSQNLSDKSPIDQHGHEHQPESFCAWMAGGGVNPGLTYGDTDDMGYRVAMCNHRRPYLRPTHGKEHMMKEVSRRFREANRLFLE